MWKSSVKLFLTKKSDHIRGWDFFFFSRYQVTLCKLEGFCVYEDYFEGEKKKLFVLYMFV